MSRPAIGPYWAVNTTTSSADVPSGDTSVDTSVGSVGSLESITATPSFGQKRCSPPSFQSEKPQLPDVGVVLVHPDVRVVAAAADVGVAHHLHVQCGAVLLDRALDRGLERPVACLGGGRQGKDGDDG